MKIIAATLLTLCIAADAAAQDKPAAKIDAPVAKVGPVQEKITRIGTAFLIPPVKLADRPPIANIQQPSPLPRTRLRLPQLGSRPVAPRGIRIVHLPAPVTLRLVPPTHPRTRR